MDIRWAAAIGRLYRVSWEVRKTLLGQKREGI